MSSKQCFWVSGRGSSRFIDALGDLEAGEMWGDAEVGVGARLLVFGDEIRGEGAAAGEPGLDLERSDIHIRDGGEIDPIEIDAGFLRLDFRAEVPTACGFGAGSSGGEFDAVELFHMEHEIDLVVILFAVVEGVFGGEQQGAYGDVDGGFFLEFAFEGVSSGFGELDVSAWEIVEVGLGISAHQGV